MGSRRTSAVTGSQAQVRLPPPPHDPRDRIVVSRAGQWEVRVFSESDPKFVYLMTHGMWHLQLFHPTRGISVLTPSALTRQCYELFPIRGWKARVSWGSDVRA